MEARIDPDAARDTGTDAAGLEGVIEVFAGLLENGTHPGAQLTVRRGGRVLLQAAAARHGPATRDRRSPTAPSS